MACSGCQQQKQQQIQQSNTSAPSIQQEQSIFARKLGKCRQCIITSIAGTIFSWVLFILLLEFTCKDCVNPLILIGMVGVAAIAFSCLSIAHGIVYLKNKRGG